MVSLFLYYILLLIICKIFIIKNKLIYFIKYKINNGK